MAKKLFSGTAGDEELAKTHNAQTERKKKNQIKKLQTYIIEQKRYVIKYLYLGVLLY